MELLRAGRSARRRARRLYWKVSPWRLYGPGLVAGILTGVLGFAVTTLEPARILAGSSVVIGTTSIIRTLRLKDNVAEVRREASRYRLAWRSEFRTGLKLFPLTFFGKGVILNDRGIPKSNSNIDHIAISRWGVCLIDTKVRGGTSRWSQSSLFSVLYDGKPLDTSITAWEAKQVVEILNRKFGPGRVHVRTAWAVYATGLPFQQASVEGIEVLPVKNIRKWIRQGDQRLTKAQRHEITKVLKHAFPPAK